MTGVKETYLTARQLEILLLRRKGLRQTDVGARMGITRQDVAILEKRAMRNLRRAAATLEIAESRGIVISFSIPEGTHILDAAKQILGEADKSDIKLVDNMVTILSLIRSACGGAMSSGVTEWALGVYLLPDGRLLFRERGRSARKRMRQDEAADGEFRGQPK